MNIAMDIMTNKKMDIVNSIDNYNSYLLDDSIDDILSNIQVDYNLDFLKKQKNRKISRKRQDAINKASKKCRARQRQINTLMKDHIYELHKLLSNNYIINNNIIDTINNYKIEVQKIKNE